VITVTLEELRNMKEEFLTASQAASVLKMDTGRLIGYAKEGQLPFPVIITGNRVKIPRRAFMKQYGLIEEEREETGKLDEILKEIHHMNVQLSATNVILMALLRHTAPEAFTEADRIFKEMEGKKQ